MAVLRHAQVLGAIGPSLLEGHLAQAAAFVEAARPWCPEPTEVLDLGSGGGIPGLVVAAQLPAARVTLLEGRTERARLLADSVAALGWVGRVEVLASRAEEAARTAHRGRYDLVVARGFGSPPVTAECAAPLLRAGGVLVVSDPPDPELAAARWPADGCRRLELEVLDHPALDWSFTVLRLEAPCPDRYPRRVGIPAKRPLF